MSQPDTTQLRDFLIDSFNLDELKDLCLELRVRYEDLEGGTLSAKARELVQYMERRNRLADLRAVLSEQRKDAYRSVFGDEAARPAISAAPRRDRRRFERNPRQVFVSHAAVDAAFAHRLADDLQRAGFAVWIAPESISSGLWVSAINRGLAESGVMLLVLTPAALESPWVEMETNVAIELERAGEMRFIPVCLVKDRYDLVLHAYQWVQFDGDYSVGLDVLIKRLNGTTNSDEYVVWLKSLPDIVFPGKITQGPPPESRPPERYVKEEQWQQLKVLAHEIAAKLGRQSGDNELREVYRQFNQHFGLTRYKKLPRQRFDEGLAFFMAWRDEVVVTMPPDRRVHEKTGIELVRVPTGPFLYGDDKRTIDLPEYWIGRAPVTNARFARFAQATSYRTTAEKEGQGIAWTGCKWEWVKGADWRHPCGPASSISGKDDHPVAQVSWDDAKAFCEWVGLALPSEEQWEKAARGTDGRIWPWGDEPPTAKHCNFGRNVGDTTPTGRYSPLGDSPYGCVDMAGNVWEWTGSWYMEGRARVLRGGSWLINDLSTRAAYRGDYYPDDGDYAVGFRVVELLSDPGF